MLPEKRKTAIAIVHENKEKAIEIRRSMLDIPEVSNSLTMVEKNIFLATTKIQIKDLSENQLIKDVSIFLKYVSRDVGLHGEIDQYGKTRLYSVIKQYYSNFTMSELKVAFEMSCIGELDNYLPKNSNKEPDKSHYQQFSVEYFTKIVNAYKKKRQQVLNKAADSVPMVELVESDFEKERYSKKRKLDLYFEFTRYKHTGRIVYKGVSEVIFYRMMFSLGLCDKIEITDEDKEKAYHTVIAKGAVGLLNKFTLERIRTEGADHEKVKLASHIISRRNQIKKGFDILIERDARIEFYLKKKTK